MRYGLFWTVGTALTALLGYCSLHLCSGPEQQGAGSFTNSVGLRMVQIEGGTFTMGLSSEELPRVLGERAASHQLLAEQFRRVDVTIEREFFCSATEVTNGEYRTFVDETGYPYAGTSVGPSGLKGLVGRDEEAPAARFLEDDKPVVLVSWVDAVEFCQWLSTRERKHYRLPTRAEWEYVARAGRPDSPCFSPRSEEFGEYAWFSENADSGTHPVAMRAPNAWGIHDMYGNAAEWSSTIAAPELVRADQEWALAQQGVDREMMAIIKMAHEGTQAWACGGGFLSAQLSCAAARGLRVDSRSPAVGFRVVADDW